MNLPCQKSGFVLGILATGQPSWKCQKHPWTKMGAVPREHDVRCAGQVLAVKPEAPSMAVKGAPDDHLGFGVPAPEPQHQLPFLLVT